MSTATNEMLYQSFLGMTEWENTIVDRFIFSNRVYATLYPKYTILSIEQYQDILGKVREKGLLVYLHAESEVIEGRIAERGDEYIVGDEVRSINDEYDKFIHEVDMQSLVLNTGELTSDEIVEKIIQTLELRGKKIGRDD